MLCILRFPFITLICLCCFTFAVSAKINNIVLDHITVEDGLSQASVMALAQDKQGYLWFGTENGINIYDGYTFSTLLGPNEDFHKYSVNHLYVASDGVVWIALFDKGLYTYDPESSEYDLIIDSSSDSKGLNVWRVVEDRKNNDFWFVTENTALHYDSVSKSIKRRIDFSDYFSNVDTLYSVSVVNEQVLFASRAGLFVYDLALEKLKKFPNIEHSNLSGTSFNQAESGKVFSATFINGRYYLGTNDGVFSVSNEDVVAFLQGKTSDLSYYIEIENISVWQLLTFENIIYIATTSGLYRLGPRNQESEFLFKFSEYFQSVADDNIISLLVDDNGQLWMGSQSSGAYKWDPKTEIVTTYVHDNSNENSLSNGNINAIALAEDQKLWVGTDAGLNLIDVEKNLITRYIEDKQKKSAFTKSNIYEIEKDYLGRLWLSTASGIKIFDGDKKKIINPKFPQKTEELLEVKDGWATIESLGEYIWVISDLGIHKVHARTGAMEKIAGLPDYFNSEYVWHIMASFSKNPNDVLISTTDTLWQYNHVSQQLTQVYHHENISKAGYSYIDRWAQDSNGLIWLSYSQVGLLAITPDDYQVKYFFNEHNSILDVNVYGVQVDSADNVWVSSHGGLFRLRAADKNIRRFTKLDGLASSEFNAGAFYQLQDGRFAYGGISGVSFFDPIALDNKNNAVNNTVSIVNVDTLSRPLNTPHTFPNNYQINLAHDDFGIRIDFSSFSYGHIESPIFKYGFIDGVSFPETLHNFVTFPRLDSGEHTFKVQVKSVVTGQYSPPALIRLNVNYAPWRSPLAYSFYVVIFIIAITLWFRSRQLRQNELVEAHKEVKYRENRLQLALSASNSDVWDWTANTDIIFAKRFVDELGYQRENYAISFAHHVEFIHPEDQDEFVAKWQVFIANADPEGFFECVYRLKCANAHWTWYRDVGKIVAFDKSGLPSRVTGSYSNITESKVIQERAQYYGAAFEQTRDWVLIFDETFEVGRANKSMSDVFGWTNEELALSKGIPGISRSRIEHYRKLLPVVLKQGYWRGEELVKAPNGREYHVIINISVSTSIEHQKTLFICVYTDISAQKTAENELRIMANYDHLTGLPNRSLLLDRIEHATASSRRSKEPIALFFIDLDRFKQVNDSLGHECGDLLLKEVSKRLSTSLRADDTLARIGGDEFVALLERFRSANELAGIAQKFINLVQQPFKLNNNVVSIGASIGISLYPNDADDSEELFRNSDVAMYHAKQLGRNNYQFFTEHMNKEAKQRLAKETNLKLAFTNEEFFNVYQPIIDAYTGKSVGAELLMRWSHDNTVVSPIEFIGLAEELGLIIPMTEQAIIRGFKQLKLWRAERPNFYLSVNFSAKHFSDKNLISSIKKQLDYFELPANALKIEITESAFIFEPEKAIKTMNELHEMGVLLSLDDFGTGFSSLSYLKQLPLDIIKIDRSFVSGIGIEKTDEAIVDATLVLAKSLNKYCIAEGVETKEQLNYLVDRQCHYIQGYFYYKPLLADEFLEKLKENTDEIKAVMLRSDSKANL
ncbi:EAL domain-containing protein [Cognaticolwellia mytili]|uniref:EAL domain-containing protein n=1 Tax=Cognaticolwellia mytili TaxID=1888913 RepID=UPI000A17872F|nr:EAL domain-containing protein [Cognaticolwellia mytili]